MLLLSEVTVILMVEFAVGILAIVAGFGYKHTYLVSCYILQIISLLFFTVLQLILGFLVGALYFVAIMLIAFLEFFAHWK